MERTASKQILKLHEVTLETKIKWSAQLLFYPKALKFIIALHAYKLDDICGLPKDLAEQDLGFAVAAFPQENGPPVVGYSLVESRNHEPPTLAMACSLGRPPDEKESPSGLSTIHKSWNGEKWTIRGLRDGGTRPHLLIPFAIKKNIPHDLYWTTNLSKEMYYQRMKER